MEIKITLYSIPQQFPQQIAQYRGHRNPEKLARSLPIANPREKQAVIDWIVQNIR